MYISKVFTFFNPSNSAICFLRFYSFWLVFVLIFPLIRLLFATEDEGIFICGLLFKGDFVEFTRSDFLVSDGSSFVVFENDKISVRPSSLTKSQFEESSSSRVEMSYFDSRFGQTPEMKEPLRWLLAIEDGGEDGIDDSNVGDLARDDYFRQMNII